MKLCVALDLPSKDECLALAGQLKGLDIWLKVGMRSYYRDGKDFVKELKDYGFKLFVDLKLYDIPNTTEDAASELGKLGVDMINIHASAGAKAMSAVMQRLKNELGSTRPLVLGVSALTSFDEADFKSVYNTDISSFVRSMSLLAKDSGLDGMVCSAYESKMIKEHCGDDFITLCPGIRPVISGSLTSQDDQARVAGVSFAHEQKADFIVVGRPIYHAKHPKSATKEILEQIAHFA